jgi:hypothetical protein
MRHLVARTPCFHQLQTKRSEKDEPTILANGQGSVNESHESNDTPGTPRRRCKYWPGVRPQPFKDNPSTRPRGFEYLITILRLFQTISLNNSQKTHIHHKNERLPSSHTAIKSPKKWRVEIQKIWVHPVSGWRITTLVVTIPSFSATSSTTTNIK